MSNDVMADFLRWGASKPKPEEPERKSMLSEDERRVVYAGATLLLVLLALLVLVFGGHATGVGACKGILLQAQKISCFQTLAYSQSNASICGYISQGLQHDSCIAAIAEAKQNASLCSSLGSSSSLYSQCVLNVSTSTGNAAYCQLLNRTYQSACAFSLAKASGFSSISACAAISDATLHGECLNLNYYNSAIATLNASYCNRIPSVTNNTLLSLIVSENISSAGSGVQQPGFLNLNATPQSYCYYKLASLTKNTALCTHTSGLLSYVCNGATTTANTVALNLTSIALACAAVPSSFRILCTAGLLTSQAISTKNVTKCLQISSTQYQYTCVTTYAIKFLNSTYCSYIANTSVQQQCMTSVASSNTVSKSP